MLRNREYHKRTLRALGMELARDPNSGFYRPARPPKLRPKRVKLAAPEQLSLNFDRPTQPLADLFPDT